MKATKIIALVFAVLFLSVQSFAQFTTKENVKKETGGSTVLDQPNSGKTVFETSRTEDINSLKELQARLGDFMKMGATPEINSTKAQILLLAQNEIARSKKDLADMKAGKTKNLEAWQAKYKPNTKLNVPLEISILSSRIDYENQVYKLISDRDYTKVREEREISTYIGYVDGFRKTMLSNLKYNSNDKTVKVPDTPVGDVPQGDGHMTKQKTGGNDMDDKRLQSWFDSQDSRKEKYSKDLAEFQKSANSGDSKSAKYAYRSLVQTMMDEVNSNNWLLGQINTGAVKLDGFDAALFSSKIRNQQQLLSEAKSIKVSTEDDLKANKTKAFSVVEKFNNTLK